jgi:hypothetical protein
MQVITHIVVVLPGPLSWTGLTIVGLLLAVAVLIALIRQQRTSNTSLRDGITSLVKEIDLLEIEFKKLVADVSQARDQFGVPTIGRPGSTIESHSYNPDQLSFWQEWVKGASELVSMLYRRIRNQSGIVVIKPADLKLRLTDFQEKLRVERNKIQQLVEFVEKRLDTDGAPIANPEHAEHDVVKNDDESVNAGEASKRIVNDQSNWAADIVKNSFREEVFGSGSSLLQLYNRAVIENQAREEFRERFKPMRIGIVNAVERRQNPTVSLAPEFKEASDGDFFAVPLDGATGYAVVPRLGLTIGAVSYNAGALGEIFGNPTYDSARAYSHYSVLVPAIFRHDNDRWIQVKPGELDLGPPD